MKSCKNSDQACKHHHRHGHSFPIVLILVGLVFLAVNVGILPLVYQPLFSSWPIWCVFIGLWMLFNRSWFSSSFLLTLGVFFLIPQIGEINPELNIPPNFTHTYWPVLLIVGGIFFALARTFGKRWTHKHFNKFHHSDVYTSKCESEDGFVRMSSSFDSRKNIVLDPVFKGGDVECNFGEIILDLRKTNLQEGTTKLDIKVSFGSVIVIVPSEWNVRLLGDSMFGTFSDSRYTPTYHSENTKTLLIDGKCSFGECNIKD